MANRRTLTDAQAEEIRRLHREGHGMRPLATQFGVSKRAVQMIVRGATYKQSRPFNPAEGTDGSNQNGV